jgi:GNAT superfamily N-acetyltransferase
MKDCTITIETSPKDEDLLVVRKGLHDYNISQLESDYERLHIFLRDETGAVVGGLFGESFWGWLYIRDLWVHEHMRGRGFGTKLMAEAEAEALKRGCRYAYLDTFTFQARPFYERLGFTMFGMLENYPTGHERIFMRKTLTPSR